MSKINDILTAAKTLLAADPKDIESLKADSEIIKGIRSLSAATLRDGEVVLDQHAEGQLGRSATREQIKVGPGQESSGAGAERMVREYSSPAPQHGTAMYPEELNRSLSFMANSMKSIETSISSLPAAIVDALKAKKAAKDDDEEEEDEEESEVVEINASKKAKDLLKKAKKIAANIDSLKSEIEDLEGGEERKAKRKSCKALISELGKILAKAQLLAYAADDSELKKSVRTIAAKADVNVVQEEEEEEEEEDDGKDKAKKALEDEAAAKAAADEAFKKAVATEVEAALKAAGIDKAKTNDKGNQADSADPKTGNQADHAKKATGDFAGLEGRLEEALKGNETLKLELKQLFDVVAGKSRLSDLVPDLSKAKVADIVSITEMIEEMEDVGQLTTVEASAAREIASLAKAAADGKMPYSRVTERLQKTSSNVIELFKTAGVRAAA